MSHMRTSAARISFRTSSARAAPKTSISGQVLIDNLFDALAAAFAADSIVAKRSLGSLGKAKKRGLESACHSYHPPSQVEDTILYMIADVCDTQFAIQ
jgi:hypothetical protein